MRKIEFDDHTIVIYSNIDDLTIGRYNAFNQFLLMDSGVGSTIEQIQSRMNRLDSFLASEKLKYARIERQNLQITFFATLHKINFSQRAFCCLLKSIDGEEYNDLSDSGLENTIQKLDEIGVTMSMIKDIVITQKKNLKNELKTYYPDQNNSIQDQLYYRALKAMTQEQLKGIESGEFNEKKYQQFHSQITDISAPDLLDMTNESRFVQNEVEHAELYALLESKGIARPEELTLVRFYGLIQQKKKENDRIRKANKSLRNGRT